MNRLFKTSSVIFLSFGILFLIFLFGFGLIIVSESSLGYVSNNLQNNILILILPIILTLLIYIIFVHKLKLFKKVTK